MGRACSTPTVVLIPKTLKHPQLFDLKTSRAIVEAGAASANRQPLIAKYSRSAQDSLNDLTMDIRQTPANAIVIVGQLLVIEAQQMQRRGMEIIRSHGILGRQAANVVGRSIGETRFETGSGH